MRARRGTIVLLALGLVAATLGLLAWRAVALQQTASQARQQLGAAREALAGSGSLLAGGAEQSSGNGASTAGTTQTASRLASACAEASGANASLQDVNGQLQALTPLLGALERVPAVGGRVRTQADTLEVGTQLAAAGVALCQGLEPLSTLLGSGGASGGAQGSAAEALRGFARSRPALLEADARLERLEQALGRLPDASVDEANRATIATLRQRLPALRQTLRDSAALLNLLGAQGPRRLLVVSQNLDELRATGGYIGSAGVAEVREGQVRLVEYGSSRQYDLPADLRVRPPYPLDQYARPVVWELAGANWWPSFPDVARQLRYFYQTARPGQTVDGVVALDQAGMALLLEALGPVELAEYGETVTAANLQEKLDQYVHDYGVAQEDTRKQFTAALASAVIERALAAPGASLPALTKAVRAALEQQHLLLWVDDAAAAPVLAAKQWDGRLLASDGDYLMLVDTEFSASKDSQYVSRDAEYRVDLSAPETPRARLSVRYTNRSDTAERPNVRAVPEYHTILRVYAPAGAALEQSEGFLGDVAAYQECGKTVFAGRVVVPRGAGAGVTLDYRLPLSVRPGGAYTLLAQRQPGAPPGTLVVSAAGLGRDGGRLPSVEVQNEAARQWHWRLDQAGGGEPRFEALPAVAASGGATGCGLEIARAERLVPPAAVEIPALGISANVVDLGVAADGLMEAPATGDVIGWYRMSARAGQPGNSVMSGHVDWNKQPAVFWGLRQLKPGDQILVKGADGRIYPYAVEWNRVYPAYQAPVEMLVGRSSETLLTLITCDGVYDALRRDYSLRRVVRATIVG